MSDKTDIADEAGGYAYGDSGTLGEALKDFRSANAPEKVSKGEVAAFKRGWKRAAKRAKTPNPMNLGEAFGKFLDAAASDGGWDNATRPAFKSIAQRVYNTVKPTAQQIKNVKGFYSKYRSEYRRNPRKTIPVFAVDRKGKLTPKGRRRV